MPHQAHTDLDLSRTGGKQRADGGRLLMTTPGAPPTIAGTALTLSGAVSGRAAEQKPFA